MPPSRIQPSEDDRAFREFVASQLRSARKNVIVIAGELGSYDFPELREAAHAAVERGVHIDVYANEPRTDVVQRLRTAGAKVVIGSIRARDHFMGVDGSTVIVSLKHGRVGPTKTGTREAEIYRDDAIRGRGVLFYFKFLEAFAAGAQADQLVRSVLDDFDRDPAPFATVPIGEDLLGTVGLSGTTVSQLHSRLLTRAHAIGLLGPGATTAESERRAAYSLAMLTLDAAVEAGFGLPVPQSLTGGSYTSDDYEKALRVVRTAVRVEPTRI